MKNRLITVIGLTGNIGTGKSTVAWMFQELGVAVLDADLIAHEVIAPKSASWKAIFERYGRSLILADDLIDRARLAEIVFRDPKERKFLESVIHPHVKEEIDRRIARFAKERHPFVIVEVPLLFEAGWEKDFDAIVVVRCSQENEIARCRQKFGFSRDEVQARLSVQHPLEEKVRAAHAVIDNDGTLEETRVQVHRLHQEMTKGTFPKS